MPTLLESVRTATKAQHNALHHHPLLVACQEKRLNLHGYGELLKAFYAPWHSVLTSMHTISPRSLKPHLLQRARLLQNDLHVLHIHHARLKKLQGLQSMTTDECLGVAYVLVGSSLGAATLVNCIKASLPNAPITYMAHPPKEAGWPLIVDHLNKREAKQHPGVITAAQNTYTLIETALNNADTSHNNTMAIQLV